jgi:hypothetical protein
MLEMPADMHKLADRATESNGLVVVAAAVIGCSLRGGLRLEDMGAS